VRVIIAKDAAGADNLGFEYLDGPVTPKPEKLPVPVRAKPKRRAPRRPKPSGGKGGGSRGSVPKVPLVKV
jgi:ATP-dependent Clp protease ATP-binding subunit ClpA